MAENITAEEFAGRMASLSRRASSTPVAGNVDSLVDHLNAFEPTRKALAYLLAVDRQNRPQMNVLENGVPCLTALQILERITFVVGSGEVGETTERTRERLAFLGELAHLANVAMGRAAIGDWPKAKEPWPEKQP